MNYDCDAITLGVYMKELEKLSDKYDFNIQLWKAGNQIYLEKDGVELTSYGGHASLITCIKKILVYIYRINKTPEEETIFFKLQNF
jgi:hypothetical protein